MDQGYGSGVWIKGMDHAVPQGMDQGMDRGVWIVCGFGALIHTLYFDSYPYKIIINQTFSRPIVLFISFCYSALIF